MNTIITVTELTVNEQIKQLTEKLNTLKSEQPKKEVREQTINRQKTNNEIKNELMSLVNVYNTFRKKTLKFPNRVKQSHIIENIDFIKEVLEKNFNKSFEDKFKNEKFDFSRLPKALTDFKHFCKFLTESQKKNILEKSFSASFIIDVLCKICTIDLKRFETISTYKN